MNIGILSKESLNQTTIPVSLQFFDQINKWHFNLEETKKNCYLPKLGGFTVGTVNNNKYPLKMLSKVSTGWSTLLILMYV